MQITIKNSFIEAYKKHFIFGLKEEIITNKYKKLNISEYKENLYKYILEKYDNIVLEKEKYKEKIVMISGEIYPYKHYSPLSIFDNYNTLDVFPVSEIINYLFYFICETLLNNNNLIKNNPKNILNNFDKNEYLKKYKNSIFIGSEFLFQHRVSSETQDLYRWKKICEDLEIRLIPLDIRYGALIQKDTLQVFIEDIHVDIRPEELGDRKWTLHPDTGLYRVGIHEDVYLDLTEEELKMYLEKNICVLEVKIKYSCAVKVGENIGFLIEEESQT